MSLESYEVVTTNVTAGDGHQDRVIKPKWPPRQQAAESLGKRVDMGAYREELHHTGVLRIVHEQLGPPPEQET